MNNEISMDVLSKALRNRSDDSLRSRILQSLGYDISNDSDEQNNALKKDTVITSSEIDEYEYSIIDTLSDYENKNFIPNDDDPDDIDKTYDVVLRKLNDYETIAYFLMKYPDISVKLLQRTIHIINKNNVILTDVYDAKIQCNVLIKRSALLISVISYLAGIFALDNYEKYYSPDNIDHSLADHIFSITNDNELSDKLSSIITQIINNIDLIQVNKLKAKNVFNLIKNEKIRAVLEILFEQNNYSALFKFSLFAQGINDEYENTLKINILSVLTYLFNHKQKEE